MDPENEKMTDIPSHLARHQPKPALTEGELLALGARAWVDQETLVVRLSQVSDPIIRRMVHAIANYLFGRRAGG